MFKLGKKKVEKGKKNINVFLRFSNAAIQMGVVITAGALGGRWLDARTESEFPTWTLTLVLFAVFASLYIIIKEALKITKDTERAEKEDREVSISSTQEEE